MAAMLCALRSSVARRPGMKAAVSRATVSASSPKVPTLGNPQMAFRLEEIETDLIARRARAEAEGWLGEIEGIDLTLRLLRQKQVEARRLASTPRTVDLGIPVLAVASRGIRYSSTLPGRGRRG
ncbi:hypothetical protein [Streptomyces sp. TE33382]